MDEQYLEHLYRAACICPGDLETVHSIVDGHNAPGIPLIKGPQAILEDLV